jgi:hypothetical protein
MNLRHCKINNEMKVFLMLIIKKHKAATNVKAAFFILRFLKGCFSLKPVASIICKEGIFSLKILFSLFLFLLPVLPKNLPLSHHKYMSNVYEFFTPIFNKK